MRDHVSDNKVELHQGRYAVSVSGLHRYTPGKHTHTRAEVVYTKAEKVSITIMKNETISIRTVFTFVNFIYF